MKPKIGIIEWPYVDKDDDRIYEIAHSMVNWINRSGGQPIGIFPSQDIFYHDTPGLEIPELTSSEKQDIIDSISMCDAIVKPGALRIYNYERFIYEYCVENDIPFLGTCAGMQLMATTMDSEIKMERIGTNVHMSKEPYVHLVKLLTDSKLYEIIGQEKFMVGSVHNYMVPNTQYHNIAGYSDDGIIEAIENPNMTFGIGVQWHPENEPADDIVSQKLFQSLIEHADGYSRKRNKK